MDNAQQILEPFIEALLQFLPLISLIIGYGVLSLALGYSLLQFNGMASVLGKWRSLLFGFIVGRVSIIILVALILTEGRTTAWLWLMAILLFLFAPRALQKKEVEQKISWKAIPWFGFLSLLILITLCVSAYQHWTVGGFQFNSSGYVVNPDPLIYASNASSIWQSRVENCVPEAAAFGEVGINLYHYFDLYECAFLANIGLQNYYEIYVYGLTSISIFSVMLSLLALAESAGRKINVVTGLFIFLLSLAPTGQIGYLWGYIEQVFSIEIEIELLQRILPNLQIFWPKLGMVAYSMVACWVLLKKKWHNQAFAMLWLAVAFNPIILPAAFGGLIGWQVYELLLRRNPLVFLKAALSLFAVFAVYKWPDWLNNASNLKTVSRVTFIDDGFEGLQIGLLPLYMLIILLLSVIYYLPFVFLGFSNNPNERWYSNKERWCTLFAVFALALFMLLFPSSDTQLPGAPALIMAWLLLVDYVLQPNAKAKSKQQLFFKIGILFFVLLYFGLSSYKQYYLNVLGARKPKQETFTKQALSLLSANRASNWGAYIYPENQKAEMPLYNRLGKEMLLYSNKYQALCISMPYLEKTLADKEIASFTLANPFYRYAKLNFDRKEEENQLAFLKEKNINWVIVDSVMVNKVPHLRAKTILRTIDATRGHELWMLKK